MFRFTTRDVLWLALPVLAGGCFVPWETHPPVARSFDAAAWRSADPQKESDREIRGSMVDDLIAKKLLDGLTESEVVDLLGPPFPKSRYTNAGIDGGNWQMAYHLGPTRDLPIDEEFLMIRLNDDGKVVSYQVNVN